MLTALEGTGSPPFIYCFTERDVVVRGGGESQHSSHYGYSIEGTTIHTNKRGLSQQITSWASKLESSMVSYRIHPINLGLGPIIAPELSYRWRYGSHASDIEEYYVDRLYLLRIEIEGAFFHQEKRDNKEVVTCIQHLGGDPLLRIMASSLITFSSDSKGALDFATVLLDMVIQ